MEEGGNVTNKQCEVKKKTENVEKKCKVAQNGYIQESNQVKYSSTYRWYVGLGG